MRKLALLLLAFTLIVSTSTAQKRTVKVTSSVAAKAKAKAKIALQEKRQDSITIARQDSILTLQRKMMVKRQDSITTRQNAINQRLDSINLFKKVNAAIIRVCFFSQKVA